MWGRLCALWHVGAISLASSRTTRELCKRFVKIHYSDLIMSTMASQITSLTIVYPTIYSGADLRKHQSSASLAFVRGIHRWPLNSPHKGPVTRKMFSFDAVMLCPNPRLQIIYATVCHKVRYERQGQVNTTSRAISLLDNFKATCGSQLLCRMIQINVIDHCVAMFIERRRDSEIIKNKYWGSNTVRCYISICIIHNCRYVTVLAGDRRNRIFSTVSATDIVWISLSLVNILFACM